MWADIRRSTPVPAEGEIPMRFRVVLNMVELVVVMALVIVVWYLMLAYAMGSSSVRSDLESSSVRSDPFAALDSTVPALE
jgi:hypothetical protein